MEGCFGGEFWADYDKQGHPQGRIALIRLNRWQWLALVAPIALIGGGLAGVAAIQLHTWGLNWVWGIVVLMLAGWRWLLVRWTRPATQQMEAILTGLNAETLSPLDTTVNPAWPPSPTPAQDCVPVGAPARGPRETAARDSMGDPAIDPGSNTVPAEVPVGSLTPEQRLQTAEAALQRILTQARDDGPVWENSDQFWQRCREVVTAIAQIYHPEVKYPLLNIYVPQAYGLLRGTVDDLDRWMQQLGPMLNQVTVGQAYEGYQFYRRLEPSARRLWQAWTWAQWLVNPIAALARTATQGSSTRAEQALIINLGQGLREATLRNLARQAIALYGGDDLPPSFAASRPAAPPLPAQTETLREILAKAEPTTAIAQQPVRLLLAGRTGAGKSSLINTLFQADLAEQDVLPSTDRLRDYRWRADTGETLILQDTPGYEQAARSADRDLVLAAAAAADGLILVTPALDPALQMDLDFLQAVRRARMDLPTVVVVTQVDRVRPVREWSPPYDWVWGDRPKEVAIREATAYRTETLGAWCDQVMPLVAADGAAGRAAWGAAALAQWLLDHLEPAQQLRLARFLRDRDTRAIAAAQIIDRAVFQLATAQGITALLKSPVLQFVATLTTGSPQLAYLLAEQIPVEELPAVLCKLQMAYDLFNLLGAEPSGAERAAGGATKTGGSVRPDFDFLALWPLLLDRTAAPDRTTWALGHALSEYWLGERTTGVEGLRDRYTFYLATDPALPRPANP